MPKRLLLFAASLVAVAALVPSANAQQPEKPPRYRVQAFARESQFYGINDAGQIVGNVGNGPALFDLLSSGDFKVTPLPFPTPPNPNFLASGTAFAINDSGQIVGESSYPRVPGNRATLWPASSQQPQQLLSFPGAADLLSSSALKINNVGHIVGNSLVQSPGGAPFFVNEATLFSSTPDAPGLDLGALSGPKPSSEARGINNLSGGELIVGTSNPGGSLHPVLFGFGGQVIDLGLKALMGQDVLGAANDINDAGQIVGFAFQQTPFGSSPPKPFLFGNNVVNPNPSQILPNITDLPGNSEALAINNNGLIVGESPWTFGSRVHPALWRFNASTKVYDVFDLTTDLVDGTEDMLLMEARDIDSAGDIIANGCIQRSFDCRPAGFLLTPIPTPEPSTLTLATAGLAWLMLLRRRFAGPGSSGKNRSR